MNQLIEELRKWPYWVCRNADKRPYIATESGHYYRPDLTRREKVAARMKQRRGQ